jgi:hypothetical protein
MSKLKEDEIKQKPNPLLNPSNLPVIKEEDNEEKFSILMDVIEGAIEEMKKRHDDIIRLDDSIIQLNMITEQIKEKKYNNKASSLFDFDCLNYTTSIFIIFGFFVLIGSALFIGILIGHVLST